MRALYTEILEQVTPTKKERKKVQTFGKQVLAELKKLGYEGEIEGSLAKDTWISGNHDVDVFMFFDPAVAWDTLEKKGLQLGKKVVKKMGGEPELAYAEHPYIRSHLNGIHLDIVPCYKLLTFERIKSSVDRTPFHTKYVKANLTEEQKAEVRLFKQFTKGIGVYSAKEKIRGFSGYLCELLILQYGTFDTLLKAISKWKYGVVSDLETFHDDHDVLRKKFKNQALIVIDPTDQNRNVAAALTNRNFERLMYAVKAFLKNRKKEFFFPNPVPPLSEAKVARELKKHKGLLIVKFESPDVVEDVLYSQLKRSLKSLVKQLQRDDFTIIDSYVYSNGDSYFIH